MLDVNLYKESHKMVKSLQGMSTGENKEDERTIQTEAGYRSIIEGIPNGIQVIDTSGVIIFCNQAFEKMMGYEKRELIGKKIWVLLEFETGSKKEELKRCIDMLLEGQPSPGPYFQKCLTKKGQIIDIQVDWNYQHNDQGVITGFVLIITDITERKRAQDALRQKNDELNFRVEEKTAELLEAKAKIKEEIEKRKKAEKALDKAVRQVEHIFDSIDQPVYVSDPDTYEILYANAIIKNKFGDVIGHKCYEAFQDMDTPCPFCRKDRIFGENACREYIHEHFDRKRGRWYHCIEKAIGWMDGKIVRYKMAIDITDRKRTEEALKDSIERYKQIFDSTMDGLVISDPDGFIQEINSPACSMLGYDPEELIGLHGKKIIAPEFYHLFDEFVQKTLNNQIFYSNVVDNRKDGSLLEIEVRGTSIKLSGKKHLLTVIRDVSAQNRAAEEIKFNNVILTTQQETSLDGILVVNEEREMLSNNQRFADMWGIPREILQTGVHKNVMQFVMDKVANPEEFLGRIEYLYAHRSEKSHEEIALTDGRTFEQYSAPMLCPDKRYYGRIWYFRDITSRKSREKIIIESRQRYRAFVDDIPALVCRFLPDGTLTFANSAYCDSLHKKREDLIGKNYFQFIQEKERERARRHFISLTEESPMISYERQDITPNGELRWQGWLDRALFDDKGCIAEYQSMGRDITEIKLAQQEKEEAEKHLRRAQKMEAIGTLAGGIAHDFNNILGAIIGYSDLARTDVVKEDPVYYYLEQILQAGFRARDLVKQILTFSRNIEQKKTTVKIIPVINEVTRLMRASLPANIDIKTEAKLNTDLVVADPVQIHQVMVNLCTNAGYAMRETGGVLRINLFEVDSDPETSLGCPELSNGSYMRIDVTDTGHGMSPDIIERIFDPYFTTKEIGEGTGLGLATVHGIVKKHGGTITVDSEKGKGTSFHIFLPKAEAMFEYEKHENSFIPGGKERVLFIDDEESLVNIATELLQSMGYEVVARTNSIEALNAFKAKPDWFDIVITDCAMPNLTGAELVKKIMGIRPDIPVIMCTGFSDLISEQKAKAMGIKEFLLKPIIAPDLAQSIRRALGKE